MMNLLDRILLGIGAGLALVIAIVIIWLSFANAHLRAELAEAHAADTACQMANDDFRSKTEQQNQAIALLNTESAARERRAAEAEQAAQKTVERYQSDAAKLAKLKSSGDDCKAAAALLDRYIGRNE
jgi:hypothetical protein